MSLNLTEFSWWHVAKAHEIDKSAFNATAWSLATFWSELTQRNRYYLALVDEKKEPHAICHKIMKMKILIY